MKNISRTGINISAIKNDKKDATSHSFLFYVIIYSNFCCCEKELPTMDTERFEQTIKAMKKYAGEQHVPIMEDEGIQHLTALLVAQQPEKVLEIGAAIGFSALKMAEALPDARIDSIE